MNFIFRNITAGNHEQIQQVFNAGLFPPIIEILTTAEYDVKKEAGWVLANAVVGGTREQVTLLIEMGMLPPMVELFSSPDTRMQHLAIETVLNVIRQYENHEEWFDL